MEKKLRFGGIVLLVLICVMLIFPLKKSKTLKLGVFAGSIWDVPNGNSYQQIEEAIALFKEEYPDVKIEFQSGIRPIDYEEWVSQQIIEDQLPDVLMVPSQLLSTWSNNGTLNELSKFVEKDEFALDRYYENSWREGIEKDGLYALPYESVPNLMFVNKTLLQQMGIETPDSDWSWEDFYKICESIHLHNESSEDQLYGYVGYQWIQAVYSNDSIIYDSEDRSLHLSDEHFIEAIEFMRKLDQLNVQADDAELFDKGQVIFCVMNYSDYRTYMPYPWRVKKFSNFEWDCIPLPKGSSGDNISQIDTLMVGMSSRSRNKELAWEFMKFLSADERVQSNLVKNSQGVSVLKSVMTSPEIMEYLKEDNPGENGFEMFAVADVMEKGIAVRKTEEYNQILQIADAGIQELLKNEVDIENGLIKIQRQIYSYLQK